MVVPKYKHSGVERNRLKRRLRELVRTRLLPTLPPADVVIRPWPNGYDATFDQLERELETVRAKLERAFARSAGSVTDGDASGDR